MKAAFVAIFVMAATARTSVVPNFLSVEFIQQINENATTWKAGKNFPEDTPLSHILSLLGSLKSEKQLLDVKEEDISINADNIPETFDSRENWPECTGIKTIADQSSCRSCWAVAAASAISDRICIHSNGAKQTPISAADLMSCCDSCGKGCQGGFPNDAWYYWVSTGVVTGGAYNSGVGCKPYPFSQCSHSVNSSQFNPCPPYIYPAPKCERECSTSSINYSDDLHKGQRAYHIRGVQNIQKEILSNGPVEATFMVYPDFLSYQSGVYQKIGMERSLGDHAVRILGWGTEHSFPYWLVANSWNEGWGDKGTFKILRGRDHCGIESDIIGGIPEN